MIHKIFKLLFITLTCLNSFCAIIEEPSRSKGMIAKFEKTISGCSIIGAEHRGLVVRLILKEKESDGRFFLYFCKKRISDGCLYLCRIIADPKLKELLGYNDPKFIKRCMDYRLLAACENGDINIVRECLDNGADPFVIDRVYNSAIFSLENNGRKCSFDVLFDKTEQIVDPKIILENKLFAGALTYGFMPKDYAKRACAFDIVVELEKRMLGGHDYKNQDVKISKDLENVAKNVKKQEANIEEAQDNIDIPSYEIEQFQAVDAKAIENFQERGIYSSRNHDLKMKALFGKNFVKVIPDKENKFKGKHLDLDALATLYAYLIFWNIPDGQKISNLFKNWSDNIYFRNLVFSYIQYEMQNNAYKLNKQIQICNVLSVADYMIKNFDKFEDSENNLIFLKNIFRYLFVLSLEPDGPKSEYKNFLKLYLVNPKARLLLKKYCEKEKWLFCPEIKREIQLDLLRKYLVKMMLCSETAKLPENFWLKIAEFWEPDERFLEYIRKPKTKIAKVKKFFSLKKKNELLA